MWFIAGFIALCVYLNGVLIQMDFATPFGDPDVWDEEPEGPSIDDDHDEDEPNAEKEGSVDAKRDHVLV